MARNLEEVEALYQRKVGWLAHSLGLPPDTPDHLVLSTEKINRCLALGLKIGHNNPTPTWFVVYLMELKRGGTQADPPNYCRCENAPWDENPQLAWNGAITAFGYLKQK